MPNYTLQINDELQFLNEIASKIRNPFSEFEEWNKKCNNVIWGYWSRKVGSAVEDSPERSFLQEISSFLSVSLFIPVILAYLLSR
jgi:hypothetical protein